MTSQDEHIFDRAFRQICPMVARGGRASFRPAATESEENMTMTKIDTPTLDRVNELKPQLEALGEFLEWLHSEGYVLGGHQYHPRCKQEDFGDMDAPCKCEVADAECWGMDEDCPYKDEHVDWLWAVPIRDRSISHENLLAKFYGIDQREMEREKQAILDHIRQLNTQEHAHA